MPMASARPPTRATRSQDHDRRPPAYAGGIPIAVVIRSEGVLHAFWVSQLAGKMDAWPGRDNMLRIEAAAPGLYHGRSPQLSGIAYAGMTFEVLAYDGGGPPAISDPARGQTE